LPFAEKIEAENTRDEKKKVLEAVAFMFCL